MFLPALCHALLLVPALQEPAPQPAPDPEQARLPTADDPFGQLEWNLYGNFFARKDTKAVPDGNGNDLSDFARVRQVDLELSSPVTETVDAFMILRLRSEPTNADYAIDFEEAYLRFEELPLLNAGPVAGVGIFRTHFGASNSRRIYELPFTLRPRSISNFFGETGYSQFGAWVQADLVETSSSKLRFYLDYVDSGEPPLTEDDGGSVGGQAARLEWSPLESAAWTDETESHCELTAGLSYMRGQLTDRNERRFDLLGADALWSRHWTGPDGPRSIHLGAEYIEGSFERDGNVDVVPSGYHAWAQYAFSPRWRVGARYDVAEELEVGQAQTKTLGAMVGYAPSNRLRFAIAVERSSSDINLLDDATRAFGEISFALGKGPRPAFWRR